MGCVMTSIDEFKKLLKKAGEDAEKEASKPNDIYYDCARIIINIERQSYYGDESSQKRLGKIREEIANSVKVLRNN